MGGGDLNTKKSWHPNTIKNQERVWKAEQEEAQEKRRIEEMRKEMEEERNREELVKHGQSSGVLEQDKDKKMDWMYKTPNKGVDHEQYLLGKKVDKHYEELVSEEQAKTNLLAPPKNHVEHECIPFSIRNLKKDVSAHEIQVDMSRKLLEDPLAAIKKREIESRAELLKNPVRLKELTKRLKVEQINSKKPSHKKKKKHKNKSDLDKKLVEKLIKLTGGSDKKISIGDLLSASKSKKKKKKKQASSSSDSSSSSEDDKKRKKRDSSEEKVSRKSKSKTRNDRRKRSSSSSSSEDEIVDKKRRKRNSSEEKMYKKSKSRNRNDNKKRNNSSSDEEDTRKRKIEKNNDDYRKKSRRNSSSPELSKKQNHQKHKNYDDDSEDDDKRQIKSYGLVKADGGKISLNKSKHNESKYEKKKEAETVKPFEKNKHVRLSEKDKEQKRLEMMKDAVQRDKEREKNIHYYRERDRKLEERDKKHGYKDDFVEKQLRVFADVGTVEGRIKSNIYNIQRSKRDMDSNFAKR